MFNYAVNKLKLIIMAKDEVILNDFKELDKNINPFFDEKKAEKAVKVKSSDDYKDITKLKVSSMENGKDGKTVINAIKIEDKESTFGYTHILSKTDIEDIKSLKYLGYKIGFDNGSRMVYLGVNQDNNLYWYNILKKGYGMIKVRDEKGFIKVLQVSKLLIQKYDTDIDLCHLIQMAYDFKRAGILDKDLKSLPVFLKTEVVKDRED